MYPLSSQLDHHGGFHYSPSSTTPSLASGSVASPPSYSHSRGGESEHQSTSPQSAARSSSLHAYAYPPGPSYGASYPAAANDAETTYWNNVFKDPASRTAPSRRTARATSPR